MSAFLCQGGLALNEELRLGAPESGSSALSIVSGMPFFYVLAQAERLETAFSSPRPENLGLGGKTKRRTICESWA